MSPANKEFLDSYPDPTWDDPEDQDEAFGTHEVIESATEKVHTEDFVPTIDDDEATVALATPRYSLKRAIPADTFVISGPLSTEAERRGFRGRLMSEEEAFEWVRHTYGHVIEVLDLPHQWAYRVYKPTSPLGRYTPPHLNGPAGGKA